MKITVPIYGEEFKKTLQNFATLRVTAQDTPDLTVKFLPGHLVCTCWWGCLLVAFFFFCV
jgi:hypothetical protein